ncbi:MAG: hypothetical protein EOP38_14210 [Rubrivivax sp.]|nr:MAG: hypothetical protein EOP38_14210 [Rubrivivax sp.]
MKNTRSWRCWALSLALLMAGPAMAEPSSPAPHELDGVAISDSVNVAGTTLVLNGAATQKRGFFKTNTCALYLPEKRDTLPGVLKLAGPKRLQLVVLRDIAGFLIARQFQTDFAANTTEDEARKLSAEADEVAAAYVKMGTLRKGDVMVVDWIPGQGIVSSLNGKSMGPPLNDELFFDVSLRPIMGSQAPRELREQLLGINRP